MMILYSVNKKLELRDSLLWDIKKPDLEGSARIIIKRDDVQLSDWPEIFKEKNLSREKIKSTIENHYKAYLNSLNPDK
ncbi:MAG: hypothetical protein R6W78_07750 [Bacteroidales bacterium]